MPRSWERASPLRRRCSKGRARGEGSIPKGRHRLGRKIGFRYLLSKKSSSFLSLITGISVGGVAVGVLTMVVTLSVMAGFESELKKRLFAAETHVLVENREGTLPADGDLVERIRAGSPVVRRVYPVLQTEVILRAGKKVNGSVVKGVGPAQLDWVRSQVIEWAPKELLEASGDARIFLGSEMAFDMGVIPGDRLTAVSPVETEGPLGAIPRAKTFVVEGVYKTGVPEQELHVVFASSRDVESFLRRAGTLTQIEVGVDRLEQAPDVAKRLQAVLGETYLVRPWQELNAHLFQSLWLERTVMFCILAFIIVVATFNIVSTLTMMVLEKRRSLSILRAIGATRGQVGAIFLWEGLAIALVGVVGGMGIGLVICGLLAKYPIIELPEFYYDRTLPVVVQPVALAAVAFATFAIVVIGAIAPARKAAELSPIEGIRDV